MIETIIAWMLIVQSPVDQEAMPLYESKQDCMEAAVVYNKIKRKQDAYCNPVEIEIVRNKLT